MGADPRAARRARPPSSPRAARAALLLAAAAAATVLLLRALRRPTPEPWTPCAPGAARAAPACAGPRQPWPLALFDHESHVHSQGDQDGVLAEIFSRLGTTNRFFAEFGFDADSFAGGVGANTQLLYAQGWRGLLMDGGHENAAIGLHREMITPGNVVGLFAKYGVPLEPDYVSIDLDSTDLWVFLALTKVYRPRVMSIEYNMNFPAGSTLTMPPDGGPWQQDRLMGASLGAIYAAAKDAGYVVVHVVKVTDAFLVRADLAACLEVFPQWAHEARVAGRALHSPVANRTRLGALVDYATWRDSGGDMEAARRQAAALLPFAAHMVEGQAGPSLTAW